MFQSGLIGPEIVPVNVKTRKGATTVDTDEVTVDGKNEKATIVHAGIHQNQLRQAEDT